MTIKLGILGCGAVTQCTYLPVLQNMNEIQLECLVDKNTHMASDLANKYKVPFYTDNYKEIFNRVDAVIIALPNYLHSLMTIEFLKTGVHVLCEKPMSLTLKECDQMIEVARTVNKKLSIGLVRRFYNSSIFVKKILDRGDIGEIKTFIFKEGGVYGWPVTSDFIFRKEQAGGGVLADTGAHVLDLLLWWLGDYENVNYYDDEIGGVDANCLLDITLKSGVRGSVELSRTRNLENKFVIIGSSGTIEVKPFGLNELYITDKILNSKIGIKLLNNKTPNSVPSFYEYIREELLNFSVSIRDNKTPFVSGSDCRESIRLIEECYKVKRKLELPWEIMQQ